ncbi:hypothetical protein Poli38472_013387 [Pythium oligandrum]|uniref:Ryanodine receptor Ryr domain-containing protein n=1 Tax=Pythium oligandrum TaxID=41045 RepID=A0A8K1FGM3_PYTOL|nr:hypothetical protein Poli38472_013387 [Pythium oligandrum]|eukprot:TMW57913.1 hypothetical protein Poli38472_013387 [Pythium oligandrum]
MDEQQYDYRMLDETIRTTLFLNYSIKPKSTSKSTRRRDAAKSPVSTSTQKPPPDPWSSSQLYSTAYGENLDQVYRPSPVDTSTIELPLRLKHLVDLLAENSHGAWARGRMDENWTYGDERNDRAKMHPSLVPYLFLTDEERQYDADVAKETLKILLALDYKLARRSARYKQTVIMIMESITRTLRLDVNALDSQQSLEAQCHCPSPDESWLACPFNPAPVLQRDVHGCQASTSALVDRFLVFSCLGSVITELSDT